MGGEEVDHDLRVGQRGLIETLRADDGVLEELVPPNQVGWIVFELGHQRPQGVTIGLLLHVQHGVELDACLLQHILCCDGGASIRIVEEGDIGHIEAP